ncbi:hypothetical protein C8J57DRAFT_963811, partial [Mycena rebaudengoi]
PRVPRLAKVAKECLQKCISEFISFITSEATGRSLNEKRKTICEEDILDVDTFISTILYARGTLEFDNYVEVLKIHLDKLREV